MFNSGAVLDGFQSLVDGRDRLAEAAAREHVFAALHARRRGEHLYGCIRQIDFARTGLNTCALGYNLLTVDLPSI
jgi:hypothetical protein